MVEANFLANIDNYNTSANNTFAIQSLRKVIDLYGDEHSKPILRKRNQNIAIPYWIIINEMTLGQTLKTISNINEKVRKLVFQTCVNEFTPHNVDIFDLNKSKSNKEREGSLINDFSKMLQFIGELRNILAHNQPVFGYNVENFDLCSFPKIEYVQPTPPKSIRNKQKQENRENPANPKDLIAEYKRSKIANYMRSLATLYGEDSFNAKITGTNINLAWIIYVIKQIVNHLGYSKFGDEIRNIFKKFNIVSFPFGYKTNIEEVKTLIQLVQDISLDKLDFKLLNAAIESGSYKKMLKQSVKCVKDDILRLKKQCKKVSITKERSAYPPFPNQQEYYSYTGINYKFLVKL